MSSLSVSPRVHIRYFINRDLPEVLAIEADRPDGWGEEDFHRTLHKNNTFGMVAEEPGTEKVIGFMVCSLCKDHVNLVHLAVHHSRRRLGVGKQLVERLTTKLPCRPRKRVTLVVREGNLTAQLFLRAQGFRALTTLRNHWTDTGEDGYLMVLPLGVGGIGAESALVRIAF